MRIFISYSRDDKQWTYDLGRALWDELGHECFIDVKNIVAAEDWWDKIMSSIEGCECFIMILTPRSAESIFCLAEMEYAVALNKPVLPLILKPCTYPVTLNARRIQYENIEALPMDKVLLRIQSGLHKITIDSYNGKYKAQTAPRPDVPTPASNDPDNIFEVFAMAEEAAAEGNDTLAEKFFKQVMDADPDGLGMAAAQRLREIRYEKNREAAWRNILRLTTNPTTYRGAQAAYQAYIRTYGEMELSAELQRILIGATPTPNRQAPPVESKPVPPVESKPAAPPPKPTPTIIVPEKPKLYPVEQILPAPFAWCDIPKGRVQLEDQSGNGGTKGGWYDVEAFRMAKYPLTNAQYEVFIRDGQNGYQNPVWWTYSEAAMAWRKKNPNPRETGFAGDDLPRTNITWYESVAFGYWLSWRIGGLQDESLIKKGGQSLIRLPTEQEWQRAAQGDDGREYPWGNEFDSKKCNTSESGIGKPVSVREYAQVESPYGVVQMSGNVWEWCLTAWGRDDIIINNKDAPRRVVRGGSWYGSQYAYCGFRRYYNPGSWSSNLGCRFGFASY